MNGKYMRQAELRWVNHDAERLEHIREKREKKAKCSPNRPAKLSLYDEGDLYDEAGHFLGHFNCIITCSKQNAMKGATHHDGNNLHL